MSGNRRNGGCQSKNTSIQYMLNNFKREFNGDYTVKLTPGKLKIFCKIDWSAFGIEWPSEWSLNKVTVQRVFEVVVGDPGHPDQFSYNDFWQDAVLSCPMWLKFHLEEACRVMVARVAAASKCREKCKKPEKPILVGEPEETPPPYVQLYLPILLSSIPLPTPLEGEAASDTETNT
jgi:hypothetical protein